MRRMISSEATGFETAVETAKRANRERAFRGIVCRFGSFTLSSWCLVNTHVSLVPRKELPMTHEYLVATQKSRPSSLHCCLVLFAKTTHIRAIPRTFQ